MPYEDVVDTMGDDMLETMEIKNGKICNDSYSSHGGEHEMDDDSYSLSYDLERNSRDNIYIWISETKNGSKDLLEVNRIVYF